MKPVVAGLVQHGCTANREENVRRSMAGIREAHACGARLIALPELHTWTYFCQAELPEHFDLAEPIPGPSTREFGALARELGVVLVISLFERRAPGVFHNTAVVLERDGAIAGTYRKTHIPNDPQFFEKYYFTPGDLGMHPIQTSVGRLGVLVCWDQWYPENARLMALGGAEVLIYPTAIGWKPDDPPAAHPVQRDAWMTIQRSHAIANSLPVMVINRTGFEPDPSGTMEGLTFWGSSFMAGTRGEIRAQANIEREEVLVASLEPAHVEATRREWPFLRDRRPDLYGGLTCRSLSGGESGEEA